MLAIARGYLKRILETTMTTKTTFPAVLVILIVGIVLFGVPTQSMANPITINNVSVTIGATVFSNTAGPFGPVAWTFPVILNDGQTLVLSQRILVPPTPANNNGYNFDTSDVPGGCPVAGCVVNVNSSLSASQNFLDTARVLSIANADPG